jgi:hypothetical protein
MGPTQRSKLPESLGAAESTDEKAAQWVLEQAGDLGISDDVLTKHSMIDGYRDELNHRGEAL